MARAVVLLFGLVNIAGGIGGYMMAKSVYSLIAGVGAGLLLLLCAAVAPQRPGFAYRFAGLISLLLVVFWAYRTYQVSEQGKSVAMPVGNLVLAAIVFLLLAGSHFAKVRSRGADPAA